MCARVLYRRYRMPSLTSASPAYSARPRWRAGADSNTSFKLKLNSRSVSIHEFDFSQNTAFLRDGDSPRAGRGRRPEQVRPAEINPAHHYGSMVDRFDARAAASGD